MGPTERAAFSELIEALAATFQREVSEAMLLGYWLGLHDLALSAVQDAVGRAVHERKFMPVPAELRELAGEMRPEDRAVKAWAAVQGALHGHDYYDTVVFDDPLTTATVRHLWHNWMQFTEATEADDEKWLRKEFERVYCSLMRTGIGRDAARPLLGFFDRENQMHGHPTRPVVKIACGLPAVAAISAQPSKAIPVEPHMMLQTICTMPEEAAR